VLQGRPDAGQYRSGTLSLNKADGVGGFKDDPVFNLMSERVARLTRIPVTPPRPRRPYPALAPARSDGVFARAGDSRSIGKLGQGFQPLWQVDRDQPEAGRAHHETGTMYAESIGAQLARRTTVWPMQ
jgi:hypothetical protein